MEKKKIFIVCCSLFLLFVWCSPFGPFGTVQGHYWVFKSTTNSAAAAAATHNIKSDYEELSVLFILAPLLDKSGSATKSFACTCTAGDVCICFGCEWKGEQRTDGEEVMYLYLTGKMIIVVTWRWWSKVNSVTVYTAVMWVFPQQGLMWGRLQLTDSLGLSLWFIRSG